MGRKIVFINQATGYLTIDIINVFASEFDEVSLITGSIRVQDVPLNKKVKVVRIIKYNRGNPVKKLFSWFWATLQILFILTFRFRSYEIFYITVPPTACLLSLFLPNKFSVLVYDIYPESLKIFNIRESNWIYRLWSAWNKRLYDKAHRIYTLGNSMKEIIARYVEQNKIFVINNWSGLTGIHPVKKEDNPFIKAYSLSDKFIVQYSGNIGYTHNVETLLEIAENFLEDQSIIFLIIGRGERFQLIKDNISSKKLSNCILLPFQPDSQIQYSLSAADLSVVILDERVASYSIPSKTYNLLAVGSALMVIGSHESEMARFVKEIKIGESFSSIQVQAMIKYIRKLKEDFNKVLFYKNNAYKASIYYTSKNAVKYLEYY